MNGPRTPLQTVPESVPAEHISHHPSGSGHAPSSHHRMSGSSRVSSKSRAPDEPHIGKYRLFKTLGRGNFAKVKLAKHLPTGREVAIKIIDKTQLNPSSLQKEEKRMKLELEMEQKREEKEAERDRQNQVFLMQLVAQTKGAPSPTSSDSSASSHRGSPFSGVTSALGNFMQMPYSTPGLGLPPGSARAGIPSQDSNICPAGSSLPPGLLEASYNIENY